jgi:glycosyltransferase involved in cell wall biosynthesis
MPQRVAVDYWPAVTHGPGVGRHVRELVRAMVRLPDAPELCLFEVGPGARSIAESALGLEGAKVRIERRRARLPRGVLRLAHRVAGIGAERVCGEVALFHRAFFDRPPLGHVPQLLPISELPAAGSVRDAALARALESIGDVLAMSTHAERELARRYAIAPERIHRADVGCEHFARHLAAPVARDDPPVVVALGAVREGRGHRALLAAFEKLRERGFRARLRIVGRRGDTAAELAERIARSSAARDVEWIDAPSEAELPRLVASASVLVHLAREELTPVTPLEACSLGLAVIASRLPAFEEALGGELEPVDGDPEAVDPELLAEAVATAIQSSRDSARTARRIAVAREFTWERHARGTLAAWRRILDRR